MPTIEELRAVLDDARKATAAAQDAEHEAHSVLRKALLKEIGLVGHIVKDRRGREFVVRRFAAWSDRFIAGPFIKKDGTLGERLGERAISEAVSLGIYTPPSA